MGTEHCWQMGCQPFMVTDRESVSTVTMLFPEILMSNDQGRCMRSLFSFDITSFFKKFSLCVTKYSLIILPLKRVSHTLTYLKKKNQSMYPWQEPEKPWIPVFGSKTYGLRTARKSVWYICRRQQFVGNSLHQARKQKCDLGVCLS